MVYTAVYAGTNKTEGRYVTSSATTRYLHQSRDVQSQVKKNICRVHEERKFHL